MTLSETIELIERFEQYVIPEPNSGCWIWTGCVNRQGYGSFYTKGHGSRRAHRASYEIFKGEIGEGLLVCHRCDQPGCVNPDHLFLGDHAENHADMCRKQRDVWSANRELAIKVLRKAWAAPKPPHRVRSSRLREADVLEIVDLRRGGASQKYLAIRFDVTQPTISAVLTGHTWGHITGIKSRRAK